MGGIRSSAVAIESPTALPSAQEGERMSSRESYHLVKEHCLAKWHKYAERARQAFDPETGECFQRAAEAWLQLADVWAPVAVERKPHSGKRKLN